MIIKNRCFAWCVLLMLVVAAGVTTAQISEEEDQDALIGVLKSNAPKGDKAIACKRLAIYGTEKAVPALAPLVADKELASWARIALEAIPGPAPDAALCEALGTLEGRLLIGTINSIGVRRDDRAVGALSQKLDAPNVDVASAAAVALGHIGGADAVKALEPRLASAPAGVRSAIAEGCILCAESYLAE
ncbi:MAG: HEAT repeat domain-containing protein, partial [Planctomycetota bacterium]